MQPVPPSSTGRTWLNLERGLFDAVFIADVVGIYDVYKNSAAPRH